MSNPIEVVKTITAQAISNAGSEWLVRWGLTAPNPGTQQSVAVWALGTDGLTIVPVVVADDGVTLVQAAVVSDDYTVIHP